jgi:hypothetical protein
MTTRLLFVVCAAASVTALLHAHATTRQAARLDLSANALVARGSEYVATYQREFAFVVADEMAEQHADPPAAGVARRITRGELFLTYLPADRKWVAVRDVAEVDGKPVTDREDLTALLQRSEVSTVARRLFDHNARYNLGSVIRNFNEPTLALSVLDRARVAQFRFNRTLIDTTTPGATLVTLEFRERDEPTIIRGPAGEAVFSAGDLTIEAENGRVRRTRFEVHQGNTTAELTTIYERQDSVGLWAPAVFAEHYTARHPGRTEVITSESTYTNYRKFQVEGRVR